MAAPGSGSPFSSEILPVRLDVVTCAKAARLQMNADKAIENLLKD